MRNCVAITLLLLTAGAVFAQNPSDSVKDAVTTVLTEQVKAWNQKDLEAFMSGYWHSPELTFFSGAEKSTGWQATLDRYRKRYQGEQPEFAATEIGHRRNDGTIGAGILRQFWSS